MWLHIYQSNPKVADAVEEGNPVGLRLLSESPLQGHRRRDITKRPIVFWVLPKYPSYLIVYDPRAKPLRILRVLHGMRDLRRLFKF
jgi:plasmid stabilization system protein ParE